MSMTEYLELRHLRLTYAARSSEQTAYINFEYGNNQIHVKLGGTPWAVIDDVKPSEFFNEVDAFLDENMNVLLPGTKKPKASVRKKKSKKS